MNIPLEQYLSKHFKYNSFKEGQLEIIQDVLQKRDVLGVLPTGSGKSLCYQLPSLLLKGTTIVVSPLISLMIDQVRELRANQIKSVIALNSFMTRQEREDVYRNLATYKLIYISPELLQHERVIRELEKIHISLFVIDEAHCISQWGHEFRQDYLRLTNVVEQLNNPPILALTATATYEVQEDILHALNRQHMIKHIYPIDRKNIALLVEEVPNNQDKTKKLLDILSSYHVPTIIYFSSRHMTEVISQEISDYLPHLRVSHYHGGLESIDRIAIQQQFMNNQLDVICCTSAFGMGINKSDIRLVIHYHFPSDLEAYIQEMGRAGRDGFSSVAITLFSREDIGLNRNIIQHDFPDNHIIESTYSLLANGNNRHISEIEQQMMKIVNDNEVYFRFLHYQLEKHGIIKNKLVYNNIQHLKEAFHNMTIHIRNRYQIKLEKLAAMTDYLNNKSCLREKLYNYFQSSYERPKNCCNNCGFTLSNWHTTEAANRTPKNEGWQEKLNQLFLIGEYDETR